LHVFNKFNILPFFSLSLNYGTGICSLSNKNKNWTKWRNITREKIIYLHQVQKKLSLSHAFCNIKKIGVCFNKFGFIFDMETIRNELIIRLLLNIWALGRNFVLFCSY
jgi:hypothetical protein